MAKKIVSLTPQQIESAMRIAGLLDQDYYDVLVHKGRVKPCFQSIITSLLRTERHPSGLARRVNRTFDHRPLYTCNYGEAPWQEQVQAQAQEQIQSLDSQDQIQTQAQSQTQDQVQLQEQAQDIYYEQLQEQAQTDL